MSRQKGKEFYGHNDTIVYRACRYCCRCAGLSGCHQQQPPQQAFFKLDHQLMGKSAKERVWLRWAWAHCQIFSGNKKGRVYDWWYHMERLRYGLCVLYDESVPQQQRRRLSLQAAAYTADKQEGAWGEKPHHKLLSAKRKDKNSLPDGAFKGRSFKEVCIDWLCQQHHKASSWQQPWQLHASVFVCCSNICDYRTAGKRYSCCNRCADLQYLHLL